MKGKVKFYNQAKGFGFITAEDGTDYFMHRTALKEGFVPGENDAVTFDLVEGEKGPKAGNVAPEGAESRSAEPEESSSTEPEESNDEKAA